MNISIITPVYNREDCISRCIESVIRNCKQDSNRGGNSVSVEHIIVDDGSTDLTSTIVEGYVKNNPHIHFIKFEQNRGTNAARNAAIDVAQGEWCIILDSDDYFVDNALQTITQTIVTHSGYKHYMFSPDDMQHYYEANPIVRGAKEKVLLYPDFLNGYIGGDFIHVCNTEILRHHPFDEKLRTYEGLFFLEFYRDAQQMLFTNKVVTIRERNRNDSVSREYIRTSNKVIERRCSYCHDFLNKFQNDLVALNMTRRLYAMRLMYLDNLVLGGKRAEAMNLMQGMGTVSNSWKEKILRGVVRCHMETLYRNLLKLYLHTKYNILHKAIN